MRKRQPNFLGAGKSSDLITSPPFIDPFFRAYVVPARPDGVKTEADKVTFGENVKNWIQTKVARHKFLRGGELLSVFSKLCAKHHFYSIPQGVVLIDVIPKR